jgi:sec-independent protein translocase protein TatB|tara:strand:- start:183 stop:416 length:234 start_codon:yes stop_codon:yes gene_type:complete
MFGISFTELLLIVFIGLIVLGPQKIPEAVKSATQSILWFRKKIKQIRQEAWETFGLNEIYQDSRNEDVLEELEKTKK